MACLQIYRELLSLTTFLRVHSNSKEVSYLSWLNAYPNSKTTCHIKLKFFLWAKLLENLLLAKYLISVTAPLIMLNNISHSSILWQKYFITFAIVSTYFLSKPVCNRNNTFMKNSSQLLKLLKHGRSCKFGYLFLFRFSASKFSIAISYLV